MLYKISIGKIAEVSNTSRSILHFDSKGIISAKKTLRLISTAMK
jgi:hypothetical protein